ncbi:MAG TPA: ATP-dependent DNA helicase [Paenalcaligenes sp.]|nr:ATP-dependent DNA helicase [Paenalcaligenes sp.]
MLSDALAQVFSANGPLAQSFSRYVPRSQQLGLAQAVEQAIEQHQVLVAEAGTGTGKTWAYLVPILLSEGKALISTGTRTLQDQLYHRDLPELCQGLQTSASAALLKGRSNYLCHYHFEQAGLNEHAFESTREVEDYHQIRLFMQHTDTGDKSDLPAVPEHASIWSKVTSTRENCLGQECPFINDCFVYKARRRAQEADIVVINHALFMADWALREEGVCDLLPDVQAVIFDEAHHLPATATRFLGISISSYQLRDFANDLIVHGQAHAKGVSDWARHGEQLKKTVDGLRLDCLAVQHEKGQKSTFEDLPDAAQVDTTLAELITQMAALARSLAAVEGHHPDLKALHQRALDLHGRLFLWTQPDRDGVYQANDLLDSAAQAQLEQPAVRWVENTDQMLRFHRAPLTVNHVFGQAKAADQAWIFTSATLSVRGDFSHFVAQLGLQDPQTCHWPSPFDYKKQAALFVPQAMPLPHSREFNAHFVEQLWPLIENTEGGTLVLCTTLRAVDDIATRLQQKDEQSGQQRTILQQGKQSRAQLLKAFVTHDRAVLVGSASFWEGVDFPGDALTVVAIDKLPFAPPDDPVISARIEQCRRDGGNPFRSLQLPAAAIALKQGAGRLIRTESDHGVLMIADTRIVEKGYGRFLWQSLPPFSRTRNLQQALPFVRPTAVPDEAAAPDQAAEPAPASEDAPTLDAS